MNTFPRSMLLLSLLIVANGTLSSSASAQERVISLPVHSNYTQMKERGGEAFAKTDLKAVQIIEFKVAGIPVLPGRRFFAGDDWLKDLTVRVKNVSNSPVSAIRVMFAFPETRYEKNGRKYSDGYRLEYYSPGYREGTTSIGFSEKGAVMPGEEIELTCNEEQYRIDIKRALGRAAASSISVAQFVAVRVDFSDGSIWEGGKPHVRLGKDEIK